MFDIGDRVFNSTSGHRGQVIGYGHQMLAHCYMPTLKVLLSEGSVEEDLYTVWTLDGSAIKS